MSSKKCQNFFGGNKTFILENYNKNKIRGDTEEKIAQKPCLCRQLCFFLLCWTEWGDPPSFSFVYHQSVNKTDQSCSQVLPPYITWRAVPVRPRQPFKTMSSLHFSVFVKLPCVLNMWLLTHCLLLSWTPDTDYTQDNNQHV